MSIFLLGGAMLIVAVWRWFDSKTSWKNRLFEMALSVSIAFTIDVLLFFGNKWSSWLVYGAIATVVLFALKKLIFLRDDENPHWRFEIETAEMLRSIFISLMWILPWAVLFSWFPQLHMALQIFLVVMIQSLWILRNKYWNRHVRYTNIGILLVLIPLLSFITYSVVWRDLGLEDSIPIHQNALFTPSPDLEKIASLSNESHVMSLYYESGNFTYILLESGSPLITRYQLIQIDASSNKMTTLAEFMFGGFFQFSSIDWSISDQAAYYSDPKVLIRMDENGADYLYTGDVATSESLASQTVHIVYQKENVWRVQIMDAVYIETEEGLVQTDGSDSILVSGFIPYTLGGTLYYLDYDATYDQIRAYDSSFVEDTTGEYFPRRGIDTDALFGDPSITTSYAEIVPCVINSEERELLFLDGTTIRYLEVRMTDGEVYTVRLTGLYNLIYATEFGNLLVTKSGVYRFEESYHLAFNTMALLATPKLVVLSLGLIALPFPKRRNGRK